MLAIVKCTNVIERLCCDMHIDLYIEIGIYLSNNYKITGCPFQGNDGEKL